VPRLLAELMMATTRNRLSLHWNTSVFCRVHKTDASVDHLQQCDLISFPLNIQKDIEDIKKYALKDLEENRYGEIMTNFSLIQV
jgi:hypothetical protein